MGQVETGTACTPRQQALGNCNVSNNGTSVVVDGSRTDHGSPGTSTPVRGDWSDPGREHLGQPIVEAESDMDVCLVSWEEHLRCFLAEQEEPEEDEDDTPAMPAITINDLATFAPDSTVLAGEPENVGVAGLPMNFVASASISTANGTLFGYPIAVRFTPVGYDFRFGDGASTSTEAPGTSWDALGQAQFTPTPTSHTYADRGEYTASVDVRYTAEIDLGIGWFPINGELTASGAGQEVRIFEAHTALVAHTCELAPTSPGC